MKLINELGKRDKMRGLSTNVRFYLSYGIKNTLKSHFRRKNVIILYVRNVIMDVLMFPVSCKPLVVNRFHCMALFHSQTMFARYYCTKSFCHLKTLEKASKSSFLYYYNGVQKREGFIHVGFEKACSRRKKTNVILTSQNYVRFYARYC